MIKFFKRNSNWIYITVLILLSCYLFLFNLGGSSLNPWDEGIYTLISNQVIEKGGLSLYLNDTLWYEKPPLGFWIQALSIKLFGLNEIAVRIPSSLYLVITSFVLYLFCRELFKNKHLAFLTSFLIITSPLLLHQHFSRSGDLDSGFLLLAVTAFYFLLRSKQNAKFFLLSGIMAGLAFMFRGTIAIFIPLISVLYLFFTKEWKTHKLKEYVYYILSLIAIILPWHIHQLIVHGQVFIDIYIKEQFLSRISAPIQNHTGSWDFYFIYLQRKIGLLYYAFWPAYLLGLYQSIVHRKKDWYLPILWITTFFAALIVIQTKINWYLIFLIPVFYILFVKTTQILIKSKKSLWITLFNSYLIILWLFYKPVNIFHFDLKTRIMTLVIICCLCLLAYIIFRKKTVNNLALKSFFIIFFVIIQLLLFYNDYKFIHKLVISDTERIANYIDSNFDSNNDIQVYKTLNWYNGWIMPDAKYYLELKGGQDTTLNNELFDPSSAFVITNKKEAAEIQNSYPFHKITNYNDLILLQHD
ncbi:hypothetical protein HN958_04535 [Candidatus Falkowbacteria bacterium]|jgi:4-amino-4-deoxy-L-arabinose transferase-like glycosyltransferase|nr:hypothetical protein [Candidatus Falkowbacteria bacterium]MBT7007744.1 hypothetical protein [Candidatus Falkowbacteria bacterium]